MAPTQKKNAMVGTSLGFVGAGAYFPSHIRIFLSNNNSFFIRTVVKSRLWNHDQQYG